MKTGRTWWVLIGLLAVEAIVFGTWGRNFGTADNVANMVRHGTEVALLALALLPVVVGGGIDLSLGSMVGLSAVVFGKAWRDGGMPWGGAALIAVATGAGAGCLNGWMVVRLRVPSLIVTLGTYSLFRGMAEALTQGVDAFTAFPASFLWLGEGRWGGVPVQGWILAAATVAAASWMHGMRWGRELRAAGFAPEGARHAGIDVGRRLVWAHGACGLVAGIAGLGYTARLGTAKADAGTGLELAAITAVVLGGASIHGGRGSVGGTWLGIAVIAVMANGLTRLPATMSVAAELTGLMTGLLLLGGMALGPVLRKDGGS